MAGFGEPQISWENITDPIKPLLDHSDCDGKLTAARCKKIAPRLRELVANWEAGHDRDNALLLADGMEEAAKQKKPIEFM